MDIKGMDKAEILAALYNGSQQLGMGFLNQMGAQNMTIEQARKELDESHSKYFDYLRGRVMKIDLSGDDLDTRLYDRDNGHGAGERIIVALIAVKQVEGNT